MIWNPHPKRRRSKGGALVAKLLARGARGEMIDRNMQAPGGKTPRKVKINAALAKFLIPISERRKL